MQIIKEKNTNRAVLMFADDAMLTLDAAGLEAPDLTVSDVSSTTHEVVVGNSPVPPLYWVAGALALDSGHWSVLDQTTYDAFVVHAQALYEKEVHENAVRVQGEIVTATQQRLDDFARTRNYDGILSLCTYATSTVPKFQAEGQYGVTARDATWAKLYEMLAEVEAGTRPMPTGFADIEPELPSLAWPGAPAA